MDQVRDVMFGCYRCMYEFLKNRIVKQLQYSKVVLSMCSHPILVLFKSPGAFVDACSQAPPIGIMNMNPFRPFSSVSFSAREVVPSSRIMDLCCLFALGKLSAKSPEMIFCSVISPWEGWSLFEQRQVLAIG